MKSTRSRGDARSAGALAALLSCALFSGAVWVGCGGGDSGDSDDGTSAAGSSGNTGGSGGSGGARALPSTPVASILAPADGECVSAAQCNGGVGAAACATIAGSYRVCTFQPAVATASSMYPQVDECDASKACASGSSCFPVLAYPGGICGTGAPLQRNACRKDGCSSDADCNGGVCGPRGLTIDDSLVGGAIRECLKAACKSNADCTAKPGGKCALVQATCANDTIYLEPEVACVYPDGCTASGNCPANSICRVVDGVGICVR